jgi:hypothetical protein
MPMFCICKHEQNSGQIICKPGFVETDHLSRRAVTGTLKRFL